MSSHRRMSSRSQPSNLTSGLLFSRLPAVIDIPPAKRKRVKRENELGIYAALNQRVDEITEEWLRAMSKRWLEGRGGYAADVDASREARSLGPAPNSLPPLGLTVCIVDGSRSYS